MKYIIIALLLISPLVFAQSFSEEKTKNKNYDFSTPQRALESYINIIKKKDKEAYKSAISSERLRKYEKYLTMPKKHKIKNYNILHEEKIGDKITIYTEVEYSKEAIEFDFDAFPYAKYVFVYENGKWKLDDEILSQQLDFIDDNNAFE